MVVLKEVNSVTNLYLTVYFRRHREYNALINANEMDRYCTDEKEPFENGIVFLGYNFFLFLF